MLNCCGGGALVPFHCRRRHGPLASQAKVIKAKRIAITGEPSITGEKVKVSKSQSALVNQYSMMEKKLKSAARLAREEQAELDAKAADDSKPSLSLPGGIKIGF